MISYRPITAADGAAVARIHAISWGSAYRSILPDAYLDHEVDADRLAHWQGRLSEPSANDVGMLAVQDGNAVGFAFAVRDDHEHWGSMLDNIHVLPQARGHGIGRGLMRELVAQLVRAGSTSGLHLWVYDANREARRFYESLGGKVLHTEVVDTAGGGRAKAHVYGWTSLRKLGELL
jgi:ribosomal protein S18 acetylase RimI-like enzyme